MATVTTIAVLGAGHMGAPIARRLRSAGHDVAAWNRTAARTVPLAGAGVRVAPTPVAAATGAEIVITMLTDAAAVHHVTSAAAPGLRPGTCLVEMSTIGPAAVHDLARRLPAGVDLVDAPVAGSVTAAATGTLTLLAGGEPTAVDRVSPALAALGTVRRCGGPGSGAALKLVLNTALLTAVTALADTVAVAGAVGVDRETALAALRAGPLGGAVGRAAATGASFAIALARKDLDLALGAVDGAAVPVARGAAHLLHAAPEPDADISQLV